MSALRISLQFAAFIMLFLFMACTFTKFSAAWKDEAYQKRPVKIMVISASNNSGDRRLFEDELVKVLKGRGIDAIVSYNNMPGKMVSDENAIAAQANAINNMPDPIVSDKITIATQAYAVGADTVLISKPRGSAIETTTGAGGADFKALHVNTQTDVYDMKSNRLVLTVLAVTWIREGETDIALIKSYLKDLVNELSRLGLF